MTMNASATPPSGNSTFRRLKLLELLQPPLLAPRYAWLTAGHFAYYNGDFKIVNRESLVTIPWAWEVEYVNGRTARSDPSAIGLGLFFGSEDPPETGGDPAFILADSQWLTLRLFFPALFRDVRPGAVTTIPITGLGRVSCYEEMQPMPGPFSAIGWYSGKNGILVKLTGSLKTTVMSSLLLSATNTAIV
jgi:hypothetical protein